MTEISDARAAFDAGLNLPALLKGGRVAAHWMADGRFWFAEGAPNHTIIKAFDPKTNAVEPLFDVTCVRTALKAAIGRELPYEGLPFAAFAPFPGGGAAFSFEGTDYILNPAGDAVVAAPKPNLLDLFLGTGLKARMTPKTYERPSYTGMKVQVAESPSPDRRWFAGSQDHNLYLRSIVDGRSEQVTHDGEPDCGWDLDARTTNPWSPDSLKLFATKFDQRGMGTITNTQILKRYDEVERVPWTRAGDKLPEVLPFIIDTMSRTAIPLDAETADKFVLFLGWAANGTTCYVALFSRDMSAAEVLSANPLTGSTRKLFTEHGESFIRIQHLTAFGGRPGCTLLPNGVGFLWQSERDGWKHLYHYDIDGAFLGPVTQGEWPVIDVLAIDAAANSVYFTAHHDQDRPYDVHLCRTPLSGGEVERLTSGEGIHDIQLAPDFSCFVDTISNPGTPPQSAVRDSDGKVLHRFEPMDISALEATGWTVPEEFAVKAADGVTDLWGVLYRPRDFDPAKSYPVIEYIYGGPQQHTAPHAFQTEITGLSAITAALPQLGYVCVILDARGTPERSKAFHDVTFREWRRHVSADHAAALKALGAERPWMDLGRVGIWGFSWGGYNTVACMIDAPDLYQVGVSASPGYDPYDLLLYEPYLGGAPGPDNRAAYEDALLLKEAPHLQGRLMIVCGTNDRGSWPNAVKMSNALIEAGKDHEFVIMPGQYHGYSTLHEAYFINKLLGHFDRYLKAPLDKAAT